MLLPHQPGIHPGRGWPRPGPAAARPPGHPGRGPMPAVEFCFGGGLKGFAGCSCADVGSIAPGRFARRGTSTVAIPASTDEWNLSRLQELVTLHELEKGRIEFRGELGN